MASPQSGRLAISPSSGQRLSVTPGARVLQSPFGDETIWRRLKEAGFDEESIKRRDKAALIAYIAKLEAEIYDHQHQMGLLILEKKELTSMIEQVKASADAADLKHKRDQAAHKSALMEARKREESLKKALGVEKECIASIEKALHEMRAESAETKVAAQTKFSEAHTLMEDAQNKLIEAETKLRAAESLETDASRYRQFAERKLQEVEAREDDLRRRIQSFNSECDTKENDLLVERKLLAERQTVLHQGEKRLLEGQALLSQREEYIMTRTQELSQTEKELEASKAELEKQRKALNDERHDLDLRAASLSDREQACIRREASVMKREQEVLILQEKISSKESIEVQKAISNHEAALQLRKSEIDAEIEIKQKRVDNEIATKQRAWELRELDLRQREDQLKEREHEMEVQFKAMLDREKNVSDRSEEIDKREKSLAVAEQEAVLKTELLQKEKDEIRKSRVDVQRSIESLEDKMKQVHSAQEKLEAMRNETDELSVLEIKLKDELDRVRAEKMEVMAEADKLKNEKATFESEWESIDEKREELRKEAQRVADEKAAVGKFLKDERDNLRIEKEALRDQYNRDADSLRAEREEFMNKITQERTEWFNKFQQERTDFYLEIEMQKRELENCIDKRREELESSSREKEKGFEQEKKNELQRINSLKESVQKEMEHITSEMKRLEIERMEVNLDRERREREWAELNKSIEELKMQREKLREQRELLHADREEICHLIEQLKPLEVRNISSEEMAVAAMQRSALESSLQKLLERKSSRVGNDEGLDPLPIQETTNASPSSGRFSWIMRKAADLVFKASSEKSPLIYNDENIMSEIDKAVEPSGRKLISSAAQSEQKSASYSLLNGSTSEKNAVGEEKMIFEVPNDVAREQGNQLRRKRKGDVPAADLINNVSVSRQNKKKRGVAAGNEPEASDSNRTTSGRSGAVDDLPASQSCNETQVSIEETRVVIVQEVTTVAAEAVVYGERLTGDQQQIPLPEPVEDADLREVINDGTPPIDPVAQKALQAQLESVGLIGREDEPEDAFTEGQLGNQNPVN